MSDDGYDEEIPRIDEEWITAPLTRAEAYSLTSKLRRMIGAVGDGLKAVQRGKVGEAEIQAYHLHMVDKELAGLMNYLLNGERPESDA